MPYTGAVGSQSQRPGSMGVRCLAQGHLGHGQLSVHQSVLSCENNLPVIGRPTVSTEPPLITTFLCFTSCHRIRPHMPQFMGKAPVNLHQWSWKPLTASSLGFALSIFFFCNWTITCHPVKHGAIVFPFSVPKQTLVKRAEHCHHTDEQPCWRCARFCSAR